MSDSKKIDYIQEKVDSIVASASSIDKEVALQKAAFEAHTKQDETMYGELKRMNDILQQNTDSLKEHMHRSDLLEGILKKMDDRLSPIEVDFLQKTAVKDWVVARLKFLGKIGFALAALDAIWMLAKPFLEHLLK